ncbi:tetratricopeptide repeat protein [Candidatus Zixiibacteriota bacterium]
MKRELSRLRNLAAELGCDDEYACARILAVAAFDDPLSLERVRELAEIPELRLGFPAGSDPALKLKNSGLAQEGVIPAPKPDIVAAAFIVSVLREDPSTAPELIWHALEWNLEMNLSRCTRLAHDAEVVLGILDFRLSEWLAEALRNNVTRCRRFDNFVWEGSVPGNLVHAGIVTYETLLANTTEDEERARLLANLSNRLSDAGENDQALAASQEAVDLYRQLAQANPARFYPDLALSLNNLSNRLRDAGENDQALAAIKEAVEIRRQLAQANPARFNPDLADSLNNLSNRLRDAGENDQALAAIQEAVELYRQLAQANPARFNPELAQSLNNLSNRLSDAGENDQALAAIQESVAIRRQLAQANPARFNPDLARSLGSMGTILRKSEKIREALAVFQEGADLTRPFAEANPNSPIAKLHADLMEELQRTKDGTEGK